jgi:hypothetical protein
MKKLLFTLVGLVTADGFITNHIVGSGMGREVNPLLQPLVGKGDMIALKVAGVLLCALLLWNLYHERPGIALVSVFSFVFVYTGIVYWNLLIYFLAWT